MTEKNPPPTTEPDEDEKLTDKELDQVAGGTIINPQPLPPQRRPQ